MSFTPSHEDPDDHPEYDNPLGNLPPPARGQSAPLPPDDQPGDDHVDFTSLARLSSNRVRSELKRRLTQHAMIAERTARMKDPARILKGMREQLAKANVQCGSDDPQIAEQGDELGAFWQHAIESWALELVAAMQDTLEQLIEDAETLSPHNRERVIEWLEAETL